MNKRTDLRLSRLASESSSDLHEAASYMICTVCKCEVPLSEAVVPEASDYVAYFCGLECYEQWHSQAERYLFASVR